MDEQTNDTTCGPTVDVCRQLRGKNVKNRLKSPNIASKNTPRHHFACFRPTLNGQRPLSTCIAWMLYKPVRAGSR